MRCTIKKLNLQRHQSESKLAGELEVDFGDECIPRRREFGDEDGGNVEIWKMKQGFKIFDNTRCDGWKGKRRIGIGSGLQRDRREGHKGCGGGTLICWGN